MKIKISKLLIQFQTSLSAKENIAKSIITVSLVEVYPIVKLQLLK
jgi:hypothetical protein